MTLDMFNFLLKIACLFFLGLTTELSMRRHFFALTVFLSSVWATVFRLSILRAVAIYVGAFGHEPVRIVNGVRNALQSSTVATITDIGVLIGTILLFRFLVRELRSKW